jgi:hypothetical protein
MLAASVSGLFCISVSASALGGAFGMASGILIVSILGVMSAILLDVRAKMVKFAGESAMTMPGHPRLIASPVISSVRRRPTCRRLLGCDGRARHLSTADE